MKNTSIEFTHDGTLITYDEQENKWKFTLRGRDRSAESLAKAKEIIDKPVPAEKAKPFEKIPAWLFKYSSETPVKVEITGIAEGYGYGRSEFVWVNNAKKRSKEMIAGGVYPSNEKNDFMVAQIIAKMKTVAELRDAIADLKSNLAPLVLPKDE